MRWAPCVFLFVALGLSVGCTKAPATGEQVEARGSARERDQDEQAKRESGPDLTLPADAEKSASGLVSKVLKPGRGDKRPATYDKVRLNFTAWNAKGHVADSSEERGGPQTFEVTGVIAGWTEALQQMQVGEQRRLWIPDQLTYPGRPGPPRPLAVFDLELLEILEGKAPAPAPADVAAVPTDATKTRSGLAYRFLERGASVEARGSAHEQEHDKPNPWDHVTIHYTGWTAAGTVIESSPSERPSSFDVAKVMPGWRELLPLLSVGDSARVWIPEALAYQGRVGEPAGSVVFDIELVSIERRPEPPRAPKHVASAPPDARKTRSGLAYRMLSKGSGKSRPSASDRVEVHYSAWTSDGALIESSLLRGTPASVPVSRLIAGWAEGLQLMVEGDKALFWIPESLAYAGRPGSPQGMLVYEVELLKIVR